MANNIYTAGRIGLTNIGNTCFMNSAIQCLIHIPEIKSLFLNLDASKIKKTKGYEISKKWIELVKALWNDEETVISIRPVTFYKEFCRYAITNGLDQFWGYGQNDVQEFIILLFDILHESIKRNCSITIKGTVQNEMDKYAFDAAKSWQNHFQNGHSKIIELFYGQLKSSIVDSNTNNILSNSYDPICDFHLPIPDDTDMYEAADLVPDIYDCFDMFCEEEDLDDIFKFKDKEYSVKKKLHIWKFPKVLMITLKRYDMLMRKNNQMIDFPLEDLDISKFCSNYSTSYPVNFDLVGVCNHVGGLHGGHYYAYCKCEDGKWRQFNDKHVTIMDKEDVVSKDAYVLFYRAK